MVDGGVMGKFFINHTQKVVMDWREVFKGFYALGGKWERDGLVPSNGASAFFVCFCIPFDIPLSSPYIKSGIADPGSDRPFFATALGTAWRAWDGWSLNKQIVLSPNFGYCVPDHGNGIQF